MKREMKIVRYDENWTNQFNEIKAKLLLIFGDLATDIQHFGSTSIKGMSAKPIIDVMVIVSNIKEVDALNEKMIEAGYIPKGENGIDGRRYFQMLSDDGINHTQHIHCYEKENQQVADELMFRDFLRIDKDAFDAYLAIKIEASQKYRYLPSEYTEYKTDCINKIMKRAKLYYMNEYQ